ncbi:MAG TPA: PepSY domain-containing protein [Allosphingosinicella sp.]|nr:PepSY domain-containing protein [Allosphingosinicella sp.]
MKVRLALRRVHIWLGWVIGIPLLIWTASGLFMAAQPIETVRGEHLVNDVPTLALDAPPVPPLIGPRPVESLRLEQRPGGARWVVRYADGGARLADPATGRLLPALTAAEAAAAVRARYVGQARISAVDRTSAEAPPVELRRPIATWRVSFDDGTRFYVDAATGEILARRTPLWRVYDLLWGLHILDLDTRDDFNNPWLVGLSAVSLVSILMALILLPMTLRRRRRRPDGAASRRR